MLNRFTLAVAVLFFLCGPAAADQSSPDGACEAVFEWYQKAGGRYRDDFSAAQAFMEPELYELLSSAFKRSPSDGFWLDFDPFVNAQVPAGDFSIGKPKTMAADLSMVQVRPLFDFSRNGKLTEGPPIKVYVKKTGGAWKVANLVHTGEAALDLKKHLQKGLGKTKAAPGDLQSALLGTWVHKATSKTADGAARPLEGVVIKWTFKPGSKFDFYQKVGNGRANKGAGMSYTLEGQTIVLGARTKYTVVKNMGNKMIWKNHMLGDFYHVVKE